MSSTAMEMLVTPEWLSRHLGADDLVVLDCTVEVGPDFRGASGRPAYEQGHIPSATNISALMLFDEQGRFRTDEELAALLETERSARHSTGSRMSPSTPLRSRSGPEIRRSRS